MPKDMFIQHYLSVMTAIAQALDTAPSLIDTFYKRSYGSEISNDDLATSGITAAQFASGITLLEQMLLLRSGANDGAGHSTISPAEYGATLAILRRDM